MQHAEWQPAAGSPWLRSCLQGPARHSASSAALSSGCKISASGTLQAQRRAQRRPLHRMQVRPEPRARILCIRLYRARSQQRINCQLPHHDLEIKRLNVRFLKKLHFCACMNWAPKVEHVSYGCPHLGCHPIPCDEYPDALRLLLHIFRRYLTCSSLIPRLVPRNCSLTVCASALSAARDERY